MEELDINNILNRIDKANAIKDILKSFEQNKNNLLFKKGIYVYGDPGTGKTTLGIVLDVLMQHLGKTFLSISLDDLYTTYADRQKLRVRRPEIIWRGPPSTHDVDLGIQVLQQLQWLIQMLYSNHGLHLQVSLEGTYQVLCSWHYHQNKNNVINCTRYQ